MAARSVDRAPGSGSIRPDMSLRSRHVAARAACAGLVLGLVLAACRAPGPGLAGGLPRARAHEPRERDFDVQHEALTLALFPEERRIEGACRVRFESTVAALAELRLDLVGLEVAGVQDEHGRALTYTHAQGELAITLAEPLARGASAELTVHYGGVPSFGLWWSGEALDGGTPTLAFTHGQSSASRGWFPCVDDPGERATSELEVDVPSGWVVTAPGARVDAHDEGGRHREHWRMERAHPAYLTSLVAGELVVQEAGGAGVPLEYLCEPRYAEWLAPTFAETPEVLSFLSEYCGLAYPYPKYSQAAVDNFPWGGMENVSATTLTPLLLSDERGHRDQPPYGLIAHEAAHQWFGDLFTCADWSHLWLNEGFATYLTLLYVEASRGADEFAAQMRDVQEAYLTEDVGRGRRPTVWNVWKEPDDVFDTRAYQGAAARLHLLRFVLGDEAFRAGVRAYAAESAGHAVTTADFQRAMERSSGRELDTFFQQWFLARGFPEFRVRWEWDEDDGRVELEVEQVQDPGDGTPAVFRLPCEVELRDRGGTSEFRFELDEREEHFELEAPERPLYVRFDPAGWIPKIVRQQRSAAEWLAIARLDLDVNARREAVQALGPLASEARTRGDAEAPSYSLELVERLRGDGSPYVRAGAAQALGQAGGREAEDALRVAAFEDPEARVRTAALNALRAFAPQPELAELALEAFAEAYSYQSAGAAAALYCACRPEGAFDWLVANLELDSPHDVLAGNLLRLVAEAHDARMPGELRRWAADPALAPAARAVAAELLGACTRETQANGAALVGLLETPSFHLRRAALRALARLANPATRHALSEYYPRARTPEERRIVEAALERVQP